MFIVILAAILALIHLYLWKRLVKDTTRAGRVRRILTAVLLGLLALLFATLVALGPLVARRAPASPAGPRPRFGLAELPGG